MAKAYENKMGDGAGYGSPTSEQKRMPGFARKTHKKYKTANVRGTRTPQAGSAMPSKRGMKGGGKSY